MSIVIDKNKCVGCTRCVAVCPGNLIKQDEGGKAFIKYPKDCWGCSSCVKECKVEAISFYLGADIGGKGSKLTVGKNGELVLWRVEKNDGEVTILKVNPKDSNKY